MTSKHVIRRLDTFHAQVNFRLRPVMRRVREVSHNHSNPVIWRTAGPTTEFQRLERHGAGGRDGAGNASLTVSGSDGAIVVTAQLSAANTVSGLVNTSFASLSPPPGNGQVAATPDGPGNILVTGELAPANLPVSNGALRNGANFVAIVSAADGALLYASRLPNGAGGIAIAPDGSGGFVVMGTDSGFFDNRMLTMLTRSVPASGPQPSAVGVTNAAGDAVSEGLVPGEKVAIFTAPASVPKKAYPALSVDGQLPLTLGGTEVFVNGTRAPILYASYDQANAIVPFEIAGSEAVNVQLQVNGQWSNTARCPKSRPIRISTQL